uniref:Histidine kinase n=1 Tax=Vibrio rotiferianus TaxID=190895 RepID=UPI001FE24377|nr:Chain A, Histidine kinase [Vibrio rotiferianus]7F2H_A Chain A, Histidine kinase [Vibrio rotiferianus]7F2H_B Chain B, Histidine kinase [Vibrio rotiferianus]
GSAKDPSLPERIDTFTELFNYQLAEKSYDIRVLQSNYPTKLLSPDSMLPQTADYPLKDIQQLYQLANTCRGKLPLSPLITEPLVFTRAICKGTQLTPRWFSRSGLIHPGGGSYAARYVDKYPELQDKLAQYMHIKERKNVQGDELLASLKSMNDDAINALIAGASMFIEQNELWLRRGDHYFVFPKSVWQENVANAGLSFKLASQTKSCFVKRGNICWDVE